MISHEILSCNGSNNTEVQKRYLTFIITNITSVSSVVDNNILFFSSFRATSVMTVMKARLSNHDASSPFYGIWYYHKSIAF